jgi:hypothetical protein
MLGEMIKANQLVWFIHNNVIHKGNVVSSDGKNAIVT